MAHILLVDDNEETLVVLQKGLEFAGHRMSTATNGREALEVLAHQSVECIVSDILMSEMDGFRLCRAVKEEPATRHLPFIFYTAAFLSDEDRELALSLGAVRFIPKPQRIADLLAEIEDALRESRLEDDALPLCPANVPPSFNERYGRVISRKLEEKTRELELYRRIFEGALDAIAILDAAGCYIDQNPAHRQLFGYDDTELAGCTMSVIVGDFLADIEQQCQQQGMFRGRVAAKTKTGEDRTLGIALFTLPGKEESAQCRVVFCRDVTDQQRAEEQLRTLSMAVKQSPVAVLITDAVGVIEYVNQGFTEITGYAPEEVIGKNPRCLQSGKTPRATYEELWNTILAGRPWRGEILNQRKDGTEYWADIRIAPLRDNDGRFVKFVAFQEDITEKKRLQEERAVLERQLLHSQKMEALGTMAGGVAHDFNNILTAILGYLELAEMRLPAQAPIRDDLRQVEAAGRRAAALVRQLLFFSRRMPGQFARMPVNCNEVIEELLKMLGRIIGEDIRIETRLDPDPWPVGGDPERLSQIIVNLAVNARDAMPEGGILTIVTANSTIDSEYCATHFDARPGQYLRLTVVDTGVGMDEVTLARIFEPFFTTKEIDKGTGLGLSVVYGLVRDMEGWIEVSSTPRRGTVFHIFLPRYTGKETVSMSETLDNGAGAVPAGRRERILVVEDDPDIRRIVVTYLEEHGYRPLAAVTAEEAMVLIEEHKAAFDLLFADVVLPGRSGIDLALQVRELCPDCRILLTSGYTDLKARTHDIERLALPYIDKPYRLPVLLKIIYELLHPPTDDESR